MFKIEKRLTTVNFTPLVLVRLCSSNHDVDVTMVNHMNKIFKETNVYADYHRNHVSANL